MAQVVSFQKLCHDCDTDAKAQKQKFASDLRTREIGPENAILIGVACGAWIDHFQEGLVQSGKEGQA